MSTARIAPKTILLSFASDRVPVIVGDLVASEAITPGMLVEKALSSSDLKWQKNASATNMPELAVYLNESEFNKGIDTACAAGDLIPVWIPEVGDVFYGIVPSGQDIALGDLLQSNGDGRLKEATSAAASANVARFKALSAPGAVTVDTRVKAEVIF